jgi:hypothetical protein
MVVWVVGVEVCLRWLCLRLPRRRWRMMPLPTRSGRPQRHPAGGVDDLDCAVSVLRCRRRGGGGGNGGGALVQLTVVVRRRHGLWSAGVRRRWVLVGRRRRRMQHLLGYGRHGDFLKARRRWEGEGRGVAGCGENRAKPAGQQ